MKRVFSILFLLVINLLVLVASSRADQRGVNAIGLKNQKTYNDECLLVAINCGSDVISLEQKIDKLRKEIENVRTVYSDEELQILKEQFDNANTTLEYFKNEGTRNWYKFPGE